MLWLFMLTIITFEKKKNRNTGWYTTSTYVKAVSLAVSNSPTNKEIPLTQCLISGYYSATISLMSQAQSTYYFRPDAWSISVGSGNEWFDHSNCGGGNNYVGVKSTEAFVLFYLILLFFFFFHFFI
jgi:hypothetical protein